MSTAMLPSTQREIPLVVREDLQSKRIEYKGVGYWVIKDPVGLKYYRLQPEQYRLLQMMDGKTSLEALRDQILREFPASLLTVPDIQHLVADLHQKGLVYSNRSGQGISLIQQHRTQRRKKFFQTLMNVLYLKLPGWDPERSLDFLYPFFRWMFHPWGVGLVLVTVLISWTLLLVQFEEFRSRLPEFQSFFGWPNLMYLWVVLGGAKIIHEFGHGLTCKHFGGECHDMGLLFLVFSPCLYCDVTDSWTMRNKWHRIMIGGAGMYIEVFLSAIAVLIWWNTQPGILHHLCLNLFFVSTITTVIFNANPLMRFDGYYMLADLLEIPNMRAKGESLLRESFAWYCLGIETPPDPFMPETDRVWFIVYIIAAAIYRWVILLSITMFLYTVLKPYGLQSIGIAMAIFSIAGIFINLGMNVYRTITTPRIDPMSVPKTTTTVVVVLLLLTGALALPLPWHEEAMFIVEPIDVRNVYVTVPGKLEKIQVQPGDPVKAGDLLLRLSNDEKEDQFRRLTNQREVQQTKVRMYHALDDPSQMRLAQETLQTIEEQLAEFQQQLAMLSITAPCDGTVIAPPRIPEPKIEETRQRLANWSNTPLDKQNEGCILPERTHVCSIAPSDQFQIVLYVDQSVRNDFVEGRQVELKFDTLPAKTYTGTIDRISERHVEYVSPLVSNKMGGMLPTVTDSEGREKLTSPAYQARTTLDEQIPVLQSGMRGTARYLVEDRSAAEWVWRYIRQTFHFRL